MHNQPSKKRVREWLQQRVANPAPPPDMKQIRRELGWTSMEKVQDTLTLDAEPPIHELAWWLTV